MMPVLPKEEVSLESANDIFPFYAACIPMICNTRYQHRMLHQMPQQLVPGKQLVRELQSLISYAILSVIIFPPQKQNMATYPTQ